MSWWTEYASRNSSICGHNFLLEIAVFRDRGSINQMRFNIQSTYNSATL